MPETFDQEQRLINITTPLGPQVLLLTGFTGEERVGGLFEFHVDLVAPTKKAPMVKFESLLGLGMTIECDVFSEGGAKKHRYLNGICWQFSELGSDDDFTAYRAVLVPKLWTLTRTSRNRIFQQQSVPDILKVVFQGLTVEWKTTGQYEKREYCVQYRESDFAFASRLMEEEGIFYFFTHQDGAHKMIVTDNGLNFPPVPGQQEVKFEVVEGGQREGIHIHDWVKRQELRSGKVTLWDHHFQRPETGGAGSPTSNNIKAESIVAEPVTIGKVTHQLKVGNNTQFELYTYPGGYAKRFDGISKSGGEQPAELSHLNQDNTRTAKLRLAAETAAGLQILGASNCPHFVPGHTFTLKSHANAEGVYYLLSVKHEAKVGTAFRSGDLNDFSYSNTFTCLPKAFTYRPPQTTFRPQVNGLQTATVVGPAGEEIFTDKYGRVKVQFPWDRDGKNDANSSCWLRVATPWAGKNWGTIHIPRIGHEVLVDFLEGDPDTPVVVGSVYNPSTMPTYKLPDHKTRSGLRSRSTLKGTAENFNEIRFEDKKGSEQIFINAEKELDFRVEDEARHFVGGNEHAIVKKDRREKIEGAAHAHVVKDLIEKVDGKATLQIAMSHETKVGTKEAVDAGMEIHLKAGMTVVIEAGTSLTLKVGGSFINISPASIAIQAPMVLINSGGSAGAGGGATPGVPMLPDTADDGTKGTKLM